LYAFGRNEALVGRALKDYRQDIHLASKCGPGNAEGSRVIDGRPENLRATVDGSLERLQTDHIDLYYLHRWDKSVPIEESMGALARIVEQGKVGSVGLSEVSAETLRRAHAVHPVAAVQTEYSLWTRNPELGVLDACEELGVAFIAFSPLSRGFLAGGIASPNDLVDGDIRRNMKGLTGQSVLVYGQTEVTRDLMDARTAADLPTVYEAENVQLHELESASPRVTYEQRRVPRAGL